MGIVALITFGFLLAGYVAYSAIDAYKFRQSIATKVGKDATRKPVVAARKDSVELLPVVTGILSSRGWADRIMLNLTRAGLRWRPSEFVGLVCGSAIVLALLGSAILGNSVAPWVGLLAGSIIPVLYLRRLQSARLKAFALQLPDALSLMGSALRSGFGLQRAAQLVAEELPAPISEEFARTLDETRTHGRAFVDALQRMVMRVGSYDLELFSVAVSIQTEVGGDLAEIIENIERTIRSRIRAEGEMAVLTAEGRLSGAILIALPIVLAALVASINPGYLGLLLTDPIGRLMLASGIALQILGAIIVKRLLKLDY